MSPRELKRTLKKLGINVEELNEVSAVILETKDSEIVIENPQVVVFTSQGQKIYQIVSKDEKVISKKPSIDVSQVKFSEDDVNFIMSQANVDREVAVQVLKDADGDIAKALILVDERKSRKV
ncbi:MAG: nascent polypeptide-associated complex protein [Sulfolobales archaeon]|nr:nascent polypeptide-associated complex protein [Sulfolobales archaeon]MDW7969154.1 nascent polypeptide-associated complex protein [Sulfolobales archaeon]